MAIFSEDDKHHESRDISWPGICGIAASSEAQRGA